MRKNLVWILLGAVFIASVHHRQSFAVSTEIFVQQKYQDFIEGELEDISISNDGTLELAPAVTNLTSALESIIWTAVTDKKGNLYYSTGPQGKVYMLGSDGKPKLIFTPNEVMVRALAVDDSGTLYVGSSPNGRIYRINAQGRAEIYFDPDEQYIWAITFDRKGNLFVATGDKGIIYKVAPSKEGEAKGEVYFDSDDSNLTSLAWDNKGSLLAGSSPSGYLYLIEKENKGAILMKAGEQEIRNIAVAGDDTLYVSSFQASVSGFSPPSMGPGSKESGHKSSLSEGGESWGDSGFPPKAAASVTPSGSAIYRVQPNGFIDRFWAEKSTSIYSLLIMPDSSLLVGTGSDGRLFSVQSSSKWKLLQELDSSQVSALLPDPANPARVIACTSNSGQILRLDFSLALEGTFTSDTLDARNISTWGNISWDATIPSRTAFEISTRSGNTEKPEKTWSDWSAFSTNHPGTKIESRAARYMQFKARFSRGTNDLSTTPDLKRVRVYYSNLNAAPVVSKINVVPSGLGVERIPMPGQPPSVSMEQLLNVGEESSKPSSLPRPQLKANEQLGLRTIVWAANDPNQDYLTYTVKVRPESATEWMTLVKETEENFITFDSNGFEEGYYLASVEASDEQDNPGDMAKQSSKISNVFLIDNTAPSIHGQTVILKGNQAEIRFAASDRTSILKSAIYMLDGKEERLLQPADMIYDSRVEQFSFMIKNLERGPHTVLIRVVDENFNPAVLSLNFEVK